MPIIPNFFGRRQTGDDSTIALDEELASLPTAADLAGNDVARETLLAALHSPHWQVRASAVAMLAETMTDTVVAAALVELEDDPSLAVRWQVASLLQDGEWQERLLVELLAALQAGDAERWQATELAASLSPASLVNNHATSLRLALLALISDPHAAVRYAASTALIALADQTTAAHLRLLLRASNPLGRRTAAATLAGLRDTTAASDLRRLLRDPDSGVRQSAAEALGQIADPQAGLPLLVALADDHAWVRAAAATSLGQIADPATLSALLKVAAHDESLTVRRASLVALTHFLDNPTIVAAMIGTLQVDDPASRVYATQYLVASNSTEATNPLRALLHDRRTVFGRSVASVAATALERLGERL